MENNERALNAVIRNIQFADLNTMTEAEISKWKEEVCAPLIDLQADLLRDE